jgi:phosphatidylserine/phosphatidylglycerophosphate/cardiolipin synthase-like enzyme
MESGLFEGELMELACYHLESKRTRFCLLLCFSIFSLSFVISPLEAKDIDVFFNNRETTSYIDPYRQIDGQNFINQGDDFEKVVIDLIDSSNISVELAVQEINLSNVAIALTKAIKRGVRVNVVIEKNYNEVLSNVNEGLFYTYDQRFQGKILEQMAFVANDPYSSNFEDFKISNYKIDNRDAVKILRNAERLVPPNQDVLRDDEYTGDLGKDEKKPRSGLMHHKFLIVDGKHLIVTSANFTRSGFHGDFNNIHSTGNSNALIRFKNSPDLAAHFQEEFHYMWNGVFKKDKKLRLAKPFILGSTGELLVKFSPMAQGEGLETSTNGLISYFLINSHFSVRGSLFSFADQMITNNLHASKLANPNLYINLLFDRSQATAYYSSLLDLWGIEIPGPVSTKCSLRENNVLFSRYANESGVPDLMPGDKLHHKFAIIDNQRVLFGSHNWSQSANSKNDETFLVIEEPRVVAEFIKEQDRLTRLARSGKGFLNPPYWFLPKIKERMALCEEFWNSEN